MPHSDYALVRQIVVSQYGDGSVSVLDHTFYAGNDRRWADSRDRVQRLDCGDAEHAIDWIGERLKETDSAA